MKFIKYTFVDVYYNESEQEQADKETRRLEKLGYTLEHRDCASGEYEYCDQYLKYNKVKS